MSRPGCCTVLTFLVGSLLLSACSGGKAVRRNDSVRVPVGTVKNGVCVIARPQGQSTSRGRGLVTVSNNPQALTADWVPGLNQRPCRVVRNQYSASVADKIAA